ncbi:MAG: carbon monoxide dehydrogenase [Lachnospiraceae bacterium]|nr:carbon monoxide dehydrogenase [Lachnospiraceae bacterium]
MKLYDEIITSWNEMLLEQNVKSLPVESEVLWPDVGKDNMILRSDMAYELGGSSASIPALGGTAITDDDTLVPQDEILLVGPDLSEIKGDVPYARLAVARVRGEEMGEGNTLYNAIRNIEYVRYHVNPKGFMMRVSAMHERESVRVSKDAIAAGLDFQTVGNMMLQSFHRNTKVEAVKIIFITTPDFPYDRLSSEIRQGEKITKTIDHMLKNIMTDCSACSLQEICDEVEGLRELHFKQ